MKRARWEVTPSRAAAGYSTAEGRSSRRPMVANLRRTGAMVEDRADMA